MEFKRQLYIADLFRPEQIINAFDYVEFNSYYAYIRACEHFLYKIKENTTVQIRLESYQEFEQMLKLFETTSLRSLIVYISFNDHPPVSLIPNPVQQYPQ